MHSSRGIIGRGIVWRISGKTWAEVLLVEPQPVTTATPLETCPGVGKLIGWTNSLNTRGVTSWTYKLLKVKIFFKN